MPAIVTQSAGYNRLALERYEKSVAELHRWERKVHLFAFIPLVFFAVTLVLLFTEGTKDAVTWVTGAITLTGAGAFGWVLKQKEQAFVEEKERFKDLANHPIGARELKALREGQRPKSVWDAHAQWPILVRLLLVPIFLPLHAWHAKWPLGFRAFGVVLAIFVQFCIVAVIIGSIVGPQ